MRRVSSGQAHQLGKLPAARWMRFSPCPHTVNENFSVTRTVNNFLITKVDRNASGGDVDVGFEYMFTPNWTFWVEWGHIFLDHSSIHFAERIDNIHRDFDKVCSVSIGASGAQAPPSQRDIDGGGTRAHPIEPPERAASDSARDATPQD
jgi:hypothetical protein